MAALGSGILVSLRNRLADAHDRTVGEVHSERTGQEVGDRSFTMNLQAIRESANDRLDTWNGVVSL